MRSGHTDRRPTNHVAKRIAVTPLPGLNLPPSAESAENRHDQHLHTDNAVHYTGMVDGVSTPVGASAPYDSTGPGSLDRPPGPTTPINRGAAS